MPKTESVGCHRHVRARTFVILLGLLVLSFCWAGTGRSEEQNPSQLPGQNGAPPSPGTQTTTGTQPTTPGVSSPSAAPEGQQHLGGLPNAGTEAGTFQFIELHSFSNLTRVTGAAADRSFLTPGNNTGVDLSYLEDFTRGVNRFELVTVGRYTDDPRVDPEHNSLQRGYFRITNPHYELNFGDYLVSYSRFTYNQNLKGVNYIWRAPWGHGFRLMANAGTFTDRYGSLFKQDIFGKPFTRVVSGVRAEQKLSDDKLVALTWAYGNDIAGSVPVDPTTGTQPFVPVQNNVVSLDSRMTFFKMWNMQGELAYSLTNPDTRCHADVPCPTLAGQFVATRKDYAARFDNTVRIGKWNFSEYFTRMMPSFYAANARQIADLQDAMFRASYQISSDISVQATYRRTNDDLREQNATPRTVFQLPEVRVSLRNLPWMGNTLFDVGYRERHQEQAGLASRITRSPFIEVGIPISSSVLSFTFEHRSNIDHLAPTNQTAANDASVSFRSIFNIGNWMFTPLLRYELNREIFDRVDTGNNNRSVLASLTLDAPKYFVFEGMYRSVGATLFQDCRVIADSLGRPTLDATGHPVCDPNPSGIGPFLATGASGFRRPSLHTSVTYKMGNNENHTVIVSYDRNQNWFALPGQNFFERVMQVAVLWRFRKRG